MMRAIFILSAAMVLSACSSTPSVTPQAKYYLLESLPHGEQTNSGKPILLNKVHLPAYLDQPNLIMRGADQQIVIANYHSWADSLADSIQRVLRNELNRAGQDYYFTESCQGCDALSITIEHFYPSTVGQVYLAGAYGLNGTQYRFNLQKNMQQSGYDEAVRQMRALLLELSEQIKGNLISPTGGE